MTSVDEPGAGKRKNTKFDGKKAGSTRDPVSCVFSQVKACTVDELLT